MIMWRWIECERGSVGIGAGEEPAGRRAARADRPPAIELAIRQSVDARLTPAQARELGVELLAAAERIDPQPPPRADRGPKRRGRGE